jgi:threonine efflux protein
MPLSYYWPSLLSVFGASLIAFLSPGPNFVGIVSSAVHSRLNGIYVAIGVSLGTTFWAVMAVTGITALLAQYASAGLIMQVIGGSYLVWLGFKSLRSAFGKKANISLLAKSNESALKCFQKGLLIQLTNPKTALFWLSMVSVVLLPETPASVSFVLILGTTIIAFAWHLILAVSFSLSRVTDAYLRFRPYISVAFGIAFVALGSRLLLWNVAGI